MKIALAQINSFLGDFSGNRQKILEFVERARQREADLVVFPEATVFGYHPCDLLERPSVVAAQEAELKKIHRALPKGVAVLVGAFLTNPKRGKPYFNAAVLLEKGKAPRVFAKELLPTYDVFDEGRHIEPGDMTKNVFRFKGKSVLVTICEDIWAWPQKTAPRFSSYLENPLLRVPKDSIDLVINLSASPFAENKMKNRRRVTSATAARFKAPLVYVNMVGGQDELIFDGASFAIDAKGRVLSQCQRFAEDLTLVDLKTKTGDVRKLVETSGEVRRQALVIGLRDFLQKNGFHRVHLGLSGGIDSAVVACLAVDALGPANVIGVGLPGPFSAPESLTLARKLADNLGIGWRELSIVLLYEHALKTLELGLGPAPFGVMNENLQARLRALLLMGFANRESSLLLATSNKSELATGYSTLYGDMCGGIMPIGDLLKHEVYSLAKLYNEQHELIPAEILDRAPSAELRPNQRDEDSLPPYEQLDPAVEKLVEGYRPPKSGVETRILHMLMKSEFKRWQAAPILKVSDHSFGRGRRLPLGHKAYF